MGISFLCPFFWVVGIYFSMFLVAVSGFSASVVYIGLRLKRGEKGSFGAMSVPSLSFYLIPGRPAGPTALLGQFYLALQLVNSKLTKGGLLVRYPDVRDLNHYHDLLYHRRHQTSLHRPYIRFLSLLILCDGLLTFPIWFSLRRDSRDNFTDFTAYFHLLQGLLSFGAWVVLVCNNFLAFTSYRASFHVFHGVISPAPYAGYLFQRTAFCYGFHCCAHRVSSPLFRPRLVSGRVTVESHPCRFRGRDLPGGFVSRRPIQLSIAFSRILVVSKVDRDVVSVHLQRQLLIARRHSRFLRLLQVTTSLSHGLMVSFRLPQGLQLGRSTPPSSLRHCRASRACPLPFLPPPSPREWRRSTHRP